jgi:hypothetical protein
VGRTDEGGGGLSGETFREEGGHYLYHYTESHLALAIAETGVFEVGGGAQYGVGLYATDLRPEEASEEEIQAICFEGEAARNAHGGVLVLLGDDDQLAFEEVEKRIFLFRRHEVGEFIEIDTILVGVGTRPPGRGWTILSWPLP